MRRSYKQSRASSSVPIRDPLADDLIGASGRDARAGVSPQPAHASGGKSLVPFWRRWWRAL
jgi:hypothetical protein